MVLKKYNHFIGAVRISTGLPLVKVYNAMLENQLQESYKIIFDLIMQGEKRHTLNL